MSDATLNVNDVLDHDLYALKSVNIYDDAEVGTEVNDPDKVAQGAPGYIVSSVPKTIIQTLPAGTDVGTVDSYFTYNGQVWWVIKQPYFDGNGTQFVATTPHSPGLFSLDVITNQIHSEGNMTEAEKQKAIDDQNVSMFDKITAFIKQSGKELLIFGGVAGAITVTVLIVKAVTRKKS